MIHPVSGNPHRCARAKAANDLAKYRFDTSEFAILRDGVQRTYVRDVEPLYQRLGQQVQHFRDLAGLSQFQLGKKIGQTRSSIANMEAGKQRIPLHVMEQIARALRVSPVELLKRSLL
jgi:DNA-binding XRE family transcriptional regulator